MKVLNRPGSNSRPLDLLTPCADPGIFVSHPLPDTLQNVLRGPAVRFNKWFSRDWEGEGGNRQRLTRY